MPDQAGGHEKDADGRRDPRFLEPEDNDGLGSLDLGGSELLPDPMVEFARIGEDPGVRRSVKPVDGQAELELPTLAGFHGALEIVRYLFPRLEDGPLVHRDKGDSLPPACLRLMEPC
jgi:hypothetical protein